ncbi:dihydrofolate reductase family protein [Rhodococcus sp. 1.20]
MRKLSVTNSVTLDGVMQAPGGPDEDRRGGFEHGGWAAPFNDSVMAQKMGEGMAKKSELLLGRRTYENFASYWPFQTDNPFTEVLDNTQKYVVSRTLGVQLPWKNSTLLKGDAADAVATLKESEGPDLVILGSGDLITSLADRRLVDTYTLLIHPLVLGTGRRLSPTELRSLSSPSPTASLRQQASSSRRIS